MDAATKKLEILKCLLYTHFHLSSKEDFKEDTQHSFSGGTVCHQLHRLTDSLYHNKCEPFIGSHLLVFVHLLVHIGVLCKFL